MFGKTRRPTAPEAAPNPGAELMSSVASSQCIIQMDTSGHVIWANENFTRLCGYQLHELVGAHHSALLTEADKSEAYYLQFWEDLNSGAQKAGTFSRVRKNGTPFYINATYSPRLGDDGKVIDVVKYGMDVTSRELAAQEMVNRSTAEITFAVDGTIKWANKSFLSAMGYSADELIGRHHRIFCIDDYANSSDYSEFWAQLRGGALVQGDFERVRKDGSTIWIRGAYTPIFGDNGSPIAVSKLVSDVSDEIARRQRVSEVANDVNMGLDQLAQASTEIAEVSRESSDSSTKLASEAADVLELSKNLEQSGEEIEDVVRMIRELAERSNLLALNATIESARAGDAGKGFAVVAGEVKELSNQTKDATQTISERVGGIQDAVKKTAKLIGGLRDGLAKQSDGSQTVAAAIEEQNAIISELNKASELLA